ncbi:PREDICTED: high choriolytic enzyme 2-like [Cyprinodon variegatus]|uniref:high choriolytic enzyme 2-like n=1 Tax=Cyprinodon variegatus TaxID=28743 RepID=UPI0007427576|nr:PREDICTED: high choriolytic enzyme 2-like [Cyprinodon variegatus]
MSAVVFLLLFLAIADVSVSVPIDNEYNIDESVGDSKTPPRPKADFETAVLYDDIAKPKTLSRNADPCTAKGCKWPKSGSYVYVPYFISESYSQKERSIIIRGLQSFNVSTCIRFVPWKCGDRDFIYIENKDGCWSYVGRQDGGQYISLNKGGCLHQSVVQHEVLHALGFNHEQVRSDRDTYVRILFENILPG